MCVVCRVVSSLCGCVIDCLSFCVVDVCVVVTMCDCVVGICDVLVCVRVLCCDCVLFVFGECWDIDSSGCMMY